MKGKWKNIISFMDVPGFCMQFTNRFTLGCHFTIHQQFLNLPTHLEKVSKA